MSRYSSAEIGVGLSLLASTIFVADCSFTEDVATPVVENQVACTESWYNTIDERVQSGDGHGHGPDVGSNEWKSVIEFKLGIRGMPDVPAREGNEWCRYIDTMVRPDGPSFSCDQVDPASIEARVCADATLSALDRKLADTYSAALSKAGNQNPPLLKAEQRGWIKGRNECWKAASESECISNEYERRIAELQARYKLVEYAGPLRFTCDGNSANEVMVTFFQTVPLTLIAERGDSVALMYQQSADSDSKYLGSNETYQGHDDEAVIKWGFDAPEMRCVRRP